MEYLWKENYPILKFTNVNGEYYIHFVLMVKVRLSNGKKINVPLYPNDYPESMKTLTDELASLVYDYLLKNDYSFKLKVVNLSLWITFLDEVIKSKLSEPLSPKYISTLDSLLSPLEKSIKQMAG